MYAERATIGPPPCHSLPRPMKKHSTPSGFLISKAEWKTNLTACVQSGDAEGLRRELQSGAQNGLDFSGLEVNGAHPVFMAARLGRAECLDALLPLCVNAQTGARLALKIQEGKAAEFCRSGAGYGFERDEGLAGADVLMVAAHAGSVDCVERLMGWGDPAGRDARGCTPLMAAALRGHAEAVRALLPHSDPILAKDQNGYTALMMAANNAREECVLDLLPHSDVSAKGSDGRNALMRAMGAYDITEPAVKALLAATDVFDADPDGNTALMIAAEIDRENLCEWIIASVPMDRRAAFVNQRNKDGDTALMRAVRNENPKNIADLLRASDATLLDSNEETLFQIAAGTGDCPTIDALAPILTEPEMDSALAGAWKDRFAKYLNVKITASDLPAIHERKAALNQRRELAQAVADALAERGPALRNAQGSEPSRRHRAL